MPACGVSPDAMANAMASGRATSPTVTPAMVSFKNLFRLYSRRQITDFGSQRSSNFREMAGHIYTIMTAADLLEKPREEVRPQEAVPLQHKRGRSRLHSRLPASSPEQRVPGWLSSGRRCGLC